MSSEATAATPDPIEQYRADAKVRVHVNVPSDKVALLDKALLRAGYKTRTSWLRAEIDRAVAADRG